MMRKDVRYYRSLMKRCDLQIKAAMTNDDFNEQEQKDVIASFKKQKRDYALKLASFFKPTHKLKFNN
ncbi:hypothetical protein [Zunongwangia sp. HGR-M22]|uniref:hypothetical protein n=1 Tax=Zunongwangia sp. HGR-M22 TaxID=3015168 RepID=UPI0022DDF33E|nr:hypothetical protein [Zunongwangia sp. HGR-M22]WBL25090.1 hypothetical protein PBT91_14450 [Zunongwangia sp. HGR-M22]